MGNYSKEKEPDGLGSIHLAQDREQWGLLGVCSRCYSAVSIWNRLEARTGDWWIWKYLEKTGHASIEMLS
jgi:hypothetical protein